ncbi:MAG: hypothetical protein ABIH65_03420 [Nanoarchaeota archaeon]
MGKELEILKGRPGLYSRFLERLFFAWHKIPISSRKDYLPYPEFRLAISRSFQITKQEAMEILRIFVDLEYVTLQKRGVKLNFKVIENE